MAKVAETLDEFRAAHKYISSTQWGPASTPRCRFDAVGRPRSHQQTGRRRNNSPSVQGSAISIARRAGRGGGPRIQQMISDAERISSRAAASHPQAMAALSCLHVDERKYRGTNGPNLQTDYGPGQILYRADTTVWLTAALLTFFFPRAPEGDRVDMQLRHHRL